MLHVVYIVFQPIAQRLGLNTQTYKLWKDRAMIELNVAILHSFQVYNYYACSAGNDNFLSNSLRVSICDVQSLACVN